MSLPALQPPCPSADSSARILKEASGVEPGWVEIMPRKRVTDQVRTWLLSAQTEERTQQQVRPLVVTPLLTFLCPSMTHRMIPSKGVGIQAPLFPRTASGQQSYGLCLQNCSRA